MGLGFVVTSTKPTASKLKDKSSYCEKTKKKKGKEGKNKGVPSSASSLEKNWTKQYRRDLPAFHVLLAGMALSTMEKIFTKMTDPTIISAAIEALQGESLMRAADSLERCFCMLRAVSISSRFRTNVMMLGNSAKQALERTWERLSAGSVSSDIENHGEANENESDTASKGKKFVSVLGSAADIQALRALYV